jgi:glycosyltransferase involved in cell wall biosynthesis
MTTVLSVIIPSRLDSIRVEDPDRLWLDRAVESIHAQSVAAAYDIEIIVGLDPGTAPPARLQSAAPDLIFANAAPSEGRQAAALNAAAARARGEYLALLEDDDHWQPRFLEHALKAIGECQFVSSNQLELPPDGTVGHINDFPTPSGWFMRRSLWLEVGEMDTSYRYHLDNDWLGRLSDAGNRRVHLVERTVAEDVHELQKNRPLLHNFIEAKPGFNFVVRHGGDGPLVLRTANPVGGMSMIAASPEAKAQSEAEQERLKAVYGRFPC